jgi:hypothetical protein
VKARDIIPGWPRPRSTSTFPCPTRDDMRLWICFFGPPSNARLECWEHMLAYHEGQQRMVNQWFERWRTPQPAPKIPLKFFKMVNKTLELTK